MAPRISALTLTVVTLLGGAPLVAADDAALGKDLKATIALQGLPCDRLVEAKRNGDSDYMAACNDGNRYHIYVNAQGRVCKAPADRAAQGAYEMRNMILPPSSLSSSDPSLSSVVATGRPQTLPLSTMKPVRKSS
jgi:hypothetical protein